MAEHELGSGFAGCDEPGSLRFLESVDQRVLARIGNFADDLRGEHPARNGCSDHHLTGGGGQAVKPLPQDQPDAFRHRDLVQPEVATQPVMLIEQHSRLDEVQVQLFNEERVAVGLAAYQLGQLLRRRLSSERPQHCPYAVERQPTQADALK